MSSLFVPPGHFYSPIPSDQDKAVALRRPADSVRGIEIDRLKMKALWNDMLPLMRTMPFDDDPKDGLRYHYINNMFSYGDASVYFAMIGLKKPKKIVEIGCGYSSALALDASDLMKLNIDFTFIDPFPEALERFDRGAAKMRVIPDIVQNVDPSVFLTLNSGDILFIDSSHVAKTGSDVCFEIFSILPILKKGVIIQFHDCFWPFEYPESWIREDNRAWNELYFLRAFLMYNPAFEIVFFNSYFFNEAPELMRDDSSRFKLNPGGGLWIRKVS